MENQRIREIQGILHLKVRENSEGQGKSGNSKVNEDAEKILNCCVQTA